MTSKLRVWMFGKFQLSLGDSQVRSKLPYTVQNLLAYLLLFRHRDHSRETLIELFWSDCPPERARNCLNTALWRLRAVLEPPEVPRGTYLVATNTEIGFNRDCDYWIDVEAFEAAILRALKTPLQTATAETIRVLEEALRLRSADLLDSVYEDWAVAEQTRQRELYLNALQYVMQFYVNHRNYQDGLRIGKQIVALEPLQEEAHRSLMRIYLERGEIALAIQQYELCYKLLQTELGCAPADETQTIYQSLVAHSQPYASRAINAKTAVTMDEALKMLSTAIFRLEQADNELRKAMQVVNQFTIEDNHHPKIERKYMRIDKPL